jgi:hypothetical protein
MPRTGRYRQHYGFLEITKRLTAKSIYPAQRAGTTGVSKAHLKELLRRKSHGSTMDFVEMEFVVVKHAKK